MFCFLYVAPIWGTNRRGANNDALCILAGNLSSVKDQGVKVIFCNPVFVRVGIKETAGEKKLSGLLRRIKEKQLRARWSLML